MAKVISLHTGKGGGGKTTDAITLFGGFILKGTRCALIDLDSDKSDAYKWGIRSPLLKENIYQIDTDDYLEYKSFVKTLSADYDYIIIDTPPTAPSVSPLLHMFALKLSDLVIIPMLPGGMELRQKREVENKCIMENVPFKILLSRWTESHSVSKAIKSMFKKEELLNAYINNTIKYVEAESKGLHISEHDKTGKESTQISNCINELIDIIG
jgi:chromosome partitioning protein